MRQVVVRGQPVELPMPGMIQVAVRRRPVAAHRDPGSRAAASACLRVPCGYRDQTHVVEEKILIIDPDHSGRETPGADVPPRL